MRVRVITSFVSGGTFNEGQELDLENGYAVGLIQGGLVAPVAPALETATVRTTDRAETATRRRQGGRP